MQDECTFLSVVQYVLNTAVVCVHKKIEHLGENEGVKC